MRPDIERLIELGAEVRALAYAIGNQASTSFQSEITEDADEVSRYGTAISALGREMLKNEGNQ